MKMETKPDTLIKESNVIIKNNTKEYEYIKSIFTPQFCQSFIIFMIIFLIGLGLAIFAFWKKKTPNQLTIDIKQDTESKANKNEQ